MKKLMSIAVAVLLVACMACPAFALDSNTETCDVTATGPSGETVAIEVSAPTETFDIPVEDGGTVDFGDGEEVPAEDLTVVYAQDLHSDVLPVTITFDVPAAGANDILHVMHYNGSAWEQVAEATGSSVTATFTSLSPVAVVLQTVKASSTPGTGETTTTSPQTGMDMTALFASVAVMLMAGVVAVAASKKNVKE